MAQLNVINVFLTVNHRVKRQFEWLYKQNNTSLMSQFQFPMFLLYPIFFPHTHLPTIFTPLCKLIKYFVGLVCTNCTVFIFLFEIALFFLSILPLLKRLSIFYLTVIEKKHFFLGPSARREIGYSIMKTDRVEGLISILFSGLKFAWSRKQNWIESTCVWA